MTKSPAWQGDTVPGDDARIAYHLAIDEVRRQEGERWRARARRWDVQERRVFVSYTGADKHLADDARERLRSRGIPTFAFDHDMKPGDKIVATVKDEVSRSTHLVVIATSTSMWAKPHWLVYEWALGEAARKELLTLVLTPNLELPDPFRQYRYVQGWAEFEQYFDRPEFDPEAVADFLAEVLGQPLSECAKYRPVAGATDRWERALVWPPAEGGSQDGGHLALDGPVDNPA